MKKIKLIQFCLVFLFFSVLIVTQAQALQFDISGINFSNLVGDTTGNLKWNLSSAALPLTFDIPEGSSNTFIYGTFNLTGATNFNAEGDSFQSNFSIKPPDPASPVNDIGSTLTVKVTGNDGYMWVDFDNTPINKTFGTGGSYTVTFLDTGTLSETGSLPLEATINFISDSQGDPPQPIPEPATMLLLGLGLAGLAGVRRKFSN